MVLKDLYNSLNEVQKILVVAIVAIVLFLVTSGVSYSIFGSKLPGLQIADKESVIPTPEGLTEEDPSIPRTEPCPLNGNLHTKAARENWEKRRPLAVMIENHEESRPQSGLTSADVVYEAVAEGGITRFMAVFYCNAVVDIQVGPVRSARTYFLDWLSEYDALYAHVGGANTPGPANALGQIIDYKVKDLNQFSIGFPTFWRDYQRLGHPVATEHTMYSTTQKLWDVGAKKGWNMADSAGVAWNKSFVSWKFKDDKAESSVTKITVPFWEGQNNYTVEWNYDQACNCYKRNNGGQAHTDLNNKKQISPKTVVVQFQKEGRANDGYEGNVHLIYTNKGEGKALVFEDGKVIEGKWMKANRLARSKFVDKSGKEVEFNKGQIWIQTVPEGSNVRY